MEGMGIFLVYLVILAAQIVLLIYSVLRPRKLFWGILLGAEGLSAAGAYLLMRHFDSLPGSGKAPGLTYFAETLYSMGASIAYCVMLGVTLIAAATVYFWKRNHK